MGEQPTLESIRQDLRELDRRVVHRLAQRVTYFYGMDIYSEGGELDNQLRKRSSLFVEQIPGRLREVYPVFIRGFCPGDEDEKFLFSENIALHDAWLLETLAERMSKGKEVGVLKYQSADMETRTEVRKLIKSGRKEDIISLLINNYSTEKKVLDNLELEALKSPLTFGAFSRLKEFYLEYVIPMTKKAQLDVIESLARKEAA